MTTATSISSSQPTTVHCGCETATRRQAESDRRPDAFNFRPVVALAGNPNVGKSSLFNALTGGRQHTGNWPGKTIERMSGRLDYGGQSLTVIDLPGTYSLTAASIEEVIARDFLVHEHPQQVVVVVDASNLERNLYFVAQLMELGLPLLVALTMNDTADARGVRIDGRSLSHALGVPVVECDGRTGRGVDSLRRALAEAPAPPPAPLRFDDAIEREIAELMQKHAPVGTEGTGSGEQGTTALPSPVAASSPKSANGKSSDPRSLFPVPVPAQAGARFDAITLLEGSSPCAAAARARIAAALGDSPDILIADRRYGWVAQVAQEATSTHGRRVRFSTDSADRILTHRILGIPIFLGFMWLVFTATARLSAPLVDGLDALISGPIAGAVQAILDALQLGDTWIPALLIDGVLAGVGGVLSFVPVLALLYLSITLLEDSGYMARAAFVMDRAMRLLGLHGKSFLPLLLGFGCTVPALYATRTLEHERDRKLTAFLATFMSCGARLPVYMVFAAAFFGTRAGTAIFALYVTGILVAIGTGLLARATVYRNAAPQPFVLELPPYRMPHPKGVARQVWRRTQGFVRKAGTTILGCAIVVWLLLATPRAPGLGSFAAVEPEASLFGGLSGLMAPALAPAGFGTWEAAGSLITGLVAKEVLLSTLAQIYGTAEETLSQTLATTFTLPAAVAFLLFVLLYAPCMSALAAMRGEFGTRFTLVQTAYTTGVAWLAAVLAYQLLTRL